MGQERTYEILLGINMWFQKLCSMSLITISVYGGCEVHVDIMMSGKQNSKGKFMSGRELHCMPLAGAHTTASESMRSDCLHGR